MAPKGQQQQAGTGGGFNPSSDVPEVILQAVIIADSFNHRFMPITKDRPRCLLPLANVPLIEYTLEFLAVAKVREIFVICCAHANQIREYIKESKWSKKQLPLTIHTIVSKDSMSIGDALRDLDNKSLIKSDFILVSGDIVSNMNLEEVLQEHRARRKKDSKAIMTMVMKRALVGHRTRSRVEDAIVVLDPGTNECLHYEPLDTDTEARSIELDMKIFYNEKKVITHPTVQVRNDLIDCQVYICAPEVPALFTENFDYQDIRRDFVSGILKSDILGNTIFAHIISNQYAARVKNTKMYDAISKDVLSRWTFPVVPDSNILEVSSYTYTRGNIYQDRNVVLARSCKLGPLVQIGSNTVVGEQTVIKNSIIGRNCIIKKNVVIEDAYIWNDVVIENNCVIKKSIVADGVQLFDGVHLTSGNLIGQNVKLGPNIHLAAYARVSLHRPDDFGGDDDEEDGDEEEENSSGTDVEGTKGVGKKSATGVGAKGKGFIWSTTDGNDDEEENPHSEKMRMLGWIGYNAPYAFHDDVEVSEDEDEDDVPAEDDDTVFKREATDSVGRAVLENHSTEDAALEINALKFAYDASFRDCRHVVVPAIASKAEGSVPHMQSVLKRWGPLIGKFTHSKADQEDVVNLLKDYYVANPGSVKLFPHAVHALYDNDVLAEEAILAWWESDAAEATDEEKKVKQLLKALVTWLQEAESDDEEEDEGDDEEDEEEDDDDDDS